MAVVGGGRHCSAGAWGGQGPRAGGARRGGTRRPALSRALAAGTVLQRAIGALEYCSCCPGKAGTPARAQPPGLAFPVKTALDFFDLAHRQVKDYWQRQREVWTLFHALWHLKRNETQKAPLVCTGCLGLVFPGAGKTPKESHFLDAQGSRYPELGVRLQPPALPDSLAPGPARAVGGSSGRRGPSGSQGRRAPAAFAGLASPAAAPPPQQRPPGLVAPESGPPRSAGPGPLGPAMPRPERRTGSRSRLSLPLGFGEAPRLPSCRSPASLLPFSPLCMGPPQARRPDGTRRPALQEDHARVIRLRPVGACRTQEYFLKASSISS
ncbi:uncharacterized protein LOC131400369 [Diceros bicornis minor]|uniref:uncharacterized protein LOC131400369 n=1 Tax=Diceros bicornis minor TaxID=77932 RepID=UPI0026EFFCFC|nr:uncharacterized protein LOC131400369 [Diceros bicornis minor]